MNSNTKKTLNQFDEKYAIGEIMDNIFNFEGIEIDHDLLERSNPIFTTARMTLFQLAAAGHDDAQDVAEKLNLTRKDTQNSTTVNVDDDDLFVNSIIMDVRYFTNGKLAKESGFTVFDLPCGFTPRAIEFAKSGRKYVGLDLPATINEVEPAVMSLLDEEQKKLVSFEGVDATNYQSLKSITEPLIESIGIVPLLIKKQIRNPARSAIHPAADNSGDPL